MDIQPMKFNYNTTAVSEGAFNQHIILYKGYISKLNAIYSDLEKNEIPPHAKAKDCMYRGLKNAETNSLNGTILHEEYFRNMTRERSMVGEKTAILIKKTFGNYDKFIECLKECANAARGWCLFAYEQRSHCAKFLMLDTHDTGMVAMAFPIIVLDMYEHAYYLDYQTNKKNYISAFIDSIDWNVVENRVCKLYG